ncbi:MAG: hypothetical protein IPJ00_21805 [Saprospirales bacterium]|nr:hypothetical protein [Saprospirales bacterium]
MNLLLESEYKGYTFISSRGGVVTTAVIKAQYDFLKHVHDKLNKSTSKKPNPAAVEKMVATLLTWFKAPAARQKQFAQRLRYGLLHYNARQYHTPSSNCGISENSRPLLESTRGDLVLAIHRGSIAVVRRRSLLKHMAT